MEWYISVIKKYAVFNGRARRKEYWMFVLFNAIFVIVTNILDSIFGTVSGTGLFGLITILYDLAVLLPSIGVMIRRLHDVGRSGWFFWINLIPIIGCIWFFVVLVTDSNPGSNKYGPNPKDDEFSYEYKQSTDEICAIKPDISVTNLDLPDQIKKLAELKDMGVITEEEFKSKKEELLNKI